MCCMWCQDGSKLATTKVSRGISHARQVTSCTSTRYRFRLCLPLAGVTPLSKILLIQVACSCQDRHYTKTLLSNYLNPYEDTVRLQNSSSSLDS
ncbi:hypothetical protein VFPPC_16924 [Pochonia chlamydosporia 170]|uniref:Uncharacterized protein n=1 Tax=Pochonia chlamydosporia 170 TaxID=1380566 RepID=A0A179F017_METCM|nr:hypothetical protein VFPPC_16924 [Pochonia chlamydosporia 170]OAQ58795.1 hypothetical protein VFPPC_16924 [Pochonia chlamydosporia 170]